MASFVGGVLSKSLRCILDYSPTFMPKILFNTSNALHVSARRNGLEEFFDNPETYTKSEVKVGRQWEKDDLRIKSNTDLHKLWYVLLKERNMLKTMEHAYQQSHDSFPSPERIEKVEEGMKNLEDVVRERNRAYFELETGNHGERPNRMCYNVFGIQENKHLEEFLEPVEREDFQEERFFPKNSSVHLFRRLFMEKMRKLERRARNSDQRYVMKMIRTFPDVDLDYLQELFPHVNVRSLLANRRTLGHFDRREASWAKRGMF